MSFSLKGKKVLVTGSTDGLGKVTALELARLGANVIVHGRNEVRIETMVKELQNLNRQGSYEGILCDFNQPESIAKAFSSIKRLDVLINNAGLWWEGSTKDIPPAKISEVIRVDLEAPLLIICALLPVLEQAEFAQILNVVSVAGIEIPFDYYHTAYTAAKFGLQGYTEALAKEYDNKNLRVMGFYPGGMETNIFVKAGNDYQKHEPWMFDPKESAETIIFMLTRDPKVNVKRMDLINHLQK